MKIFDLHCDTLTRSFDENLDPISGSQTHISFSNSKYFETWVQCLAIFTHDNIKGEKATEYFKNVVNYLETLKSKCDNLKELKSLNELENSPEENKFRYILTLENASVLNGNINNIDLLQKAGVKVSTLTWNGENELAGGIASDAGISSFGRSVVKEFEKRNIIIDASHLNDKSFYDLCKIAEKPFISTHTNSRSVCHMQRNLKDDQSKEIFSRGGIIGINFFPKFIEQYNSKSYFDDFYAHIYHFLSMGGEKLLCLGSDFDGCDLEDKISGQLDVFRIYDYLLSKNISENVLEDIFYNNAFNFFKRNL